MTPRSGAEFQLLNPGRRITLANALQPSCLRLLRMSSTCGGLESSSAGSRGEHLGQAVLARHRRRDVSVEQVDDLVLVVDVNRVTGPARAEEATVVAAGAVDLDLGVGERHDHPSPNRGGGACADDGGVEDLGSLELASHVELDHVIQADERQDRRERSLEDEGLDCHQHPRSSRFVHVIIGTARRHPGERAKLLV